MKWGIWMACLVVHAHEFLFFFLFMKIPRDE
jgi:hypothetical protein